METCHLLQLTPQIYGGNSSVRLFDASSLQSVSSIQVWSLHWYPAPQLSLVMHPKEIAEILCLHKLVTWFAFVVCQITPETGSVGVTSYVTDPIKIVTHIVT